MAARPWTLDEIAARIAAELPDGSYVNLGIGMPQLVSNHVPPGREVIYHCEHGLLGVGPEPPPDQADPDLIDAGSKPVTLIPGAAIFPHDLSFAMIRGGHIDVTVLGAYQVSGSGDLANWAIAGQSPPSGVGGAMDLAVGARKVFVMMRHLDKQGKPKIVNQCSYPLTAPRCVSRIFTDLAVIDVTSEGLVVREMAPGLTIDELQRATEPPLRLAASIG